MDHSKVEEKLAGFGWSSLNGIDPNPENFCGAGIITTSAGQFGCLYRLEPNNKAQVREKNSFFLDEIISYPLSLSLFFLDVSFNNSLKSRNSFKKTYAIIRKSILILLSGIMMKKMKT
jgi:hypothetical protein